MLYQQVIISSSGGRSTTSEPELRQNDYAMLAPQVTEEDLEALRQLVSTMGEAVDYAENHDEVPPLDVIFYREGFAEAGRMLTKAMTAFKAN